MPFTLRDDFAPGTPGNVCSLCHACQRDVRGGGREPIVDPETMVGDPEMPGQFPLQICATCAVEMGRLVGMVAPDEIEAAREAEATATAEADQLRSERDDLRTALDALMRAGLAVLTEHDEPADAAPSGLFTDILTKSKTTTT